MSAGGCGMQCPCFIPTARVVYAQEIAHNCANLREINLGDTKVTDAGVQETVKPLCDAGAAWQRDSKTAFRLAKEAY